MKIPDLNFPSEDYRTTLAKIVGYFRGYRGVYAVVLTGSLARGKAVIGSCIDLSIFLDRRHLRLLAATVNSRMEAYSRLHGQICYYEGEIEGGIEFGDVRVDLGFTDGSFSCDHVHSFDIVRDDLEATIGNLLVYSVPLFLKGKRFQRLKQRYLPFYDDSLRKIRLKGTAEEFDYKIWRTRWLAKRGGFFAALYALLEAQRIFLQHLFIKERKYPIDYVKWLREQCDQVLAMPHLYQELTSTLDKIELTEKGIFEKSDLLEKLFRRYGSASSLSR